jgi:hypothetical protein
VADHEADGLAALGLSGSPPTSDPLLVRHLVILSIGLAVTLAAGAVLLVVVLPAVAEVFARVVVFITRMLTGG